MRYDIEQLKNAVLNSECWSDVCRKLDVTICTFNFKRMQKLCKANNIDYAHFAEMLNKTFRRNKKQWLHEEVYCEKSEFPRSSLRRRILADELMPYRCGSCGNDGQWMGIDLTLEVEHINGINDDNRTSNLKWLCPNCHSQTPTYRNSKNRAGSLAV